MQPNHIIHVYAFLSYPKYKMEKHEPKPGNSPKLSGAAELLLAFVGSAIFGLVLVYVFRNQVLDFFTQFLK